MDPSPPGPDMALDRREHARLWDADETARFIAAEAASSLREILDPAEPRWRVARVVELGCGTGLLTEHLAGWFDEIVAIDHSPEMLEVLVGKNLRGVATHAADVTELDPVPAWLVGAEVVVACCLFGVLPCPAQTVARVARIMKPGGLLVQWDWLDDDDEDGVSLDAIERAYLAAGLVPHHVDHAFDADDVPLVMGVGAKPG